MFQEVAVGASLLARREGQIGEEHEWGRGGEMVMREGNVVQ